MNLGKLALAAAAAHASVASAETLRDVLEDPDYFGTLLAAIDASAVGPAGPNLKEALASDEGTLTIFAPVDEGFDELPEELVTKLLNATWQPQLQDLLLYHVLDSVVRYSEFGEGLTLETLNGEDIDVDLDPPRVNDVSGIFDDHEIVADNGVLHGIEKVLVPSSVTNDIVATLEITSLPSTSRTTRAGDDFSTLVAAVTAADLVDALKGEGPLTVFAPTNDAFDALPDGTVESLLQPENKDQLVDILLYHVVPANAHSAGLAAGEVPTLNGDAVALEVSGDGVAVNGANVIEADIIASNGIIHVIDAVLLPPAEPDDTATSSDEAPGDGDAPASIYDIAGSTDDFSTLAAAVKASAVGPAGPSLVDALSGDGTFTVFAPPNSAFDKLPEELVTKLLNATWQPQLQDVLLYHALGSEVLSTDLSEGLMAPTLNGEDITVSLDPPRINEDSNIITGLFDIEASNGVIHAVDSVLTPASVTSTIVDLATANDDFSTLVTAVVAADLAGALSGEGPLTVFAPTNDAFQALSDGAAGPLPITNTERLTDILLYHVVAANAHSAGLASGDVPTLNGDTLSVEVSDGGVTVNGANVVATDIIASNGIIHVVDAVLMPPSPASPVAAAKTIEVSDWVVPYEGPKELEANVGDTIVFRWTGLHNVYIHPSMSCDLEGRILVGEESGSQHTFTEDEGSPDGTEHFFSCDIGSGAHCRAGQFLTVTVFSAAADGADDDDADPGSIYEIAGGADAFSTLAAAIDASAVGPVGPNLVDALSGDGAFTVFAPPDSAFEKLPEELLTKLLNPTWQPQLQDVLLYHALGSEVLSSDLEDGLTATALNGEGIVINLDPPRVNNNSILIDDGLVDIEADNGVIHAVDSVLTPASVTSNIVDLLTSSFLFSTLVAAVTAADLVGALSGDGPLTVFAPTNEAFAALPDGTVDTLLMPENKDQLVNILLYHVVAANAHSAGLASGEVETLNGDSVAVAFSDGGVTVNGATVQTADIIASNGIIHFIDTVLLPPTSGTATTEAPGTTTTDASGTTTTDASGTTTTDASGTLTTDASGTTTTDASGTTTTDAPVEGTDSGSIYDIASGTEDFSTLAVAIDASAVGPAGPNLIDALSGDGTFTVFAPPNSAFEKLPEELVTKLLNPTWQPQLQDVLLYHALGSEVLSADLEDGFVDTATTLNGEDIIVNLGPPRINNNSNILIDEGLFDIEASNGVIHAVDSVLTPASVTSNIVDLAVASDDFSTLVAAVTAADLAGALSGDGPLTVFAPTNEAFAALPDGTVDTLLMPENKDQLVDILLYHVVAANAHSAGLANGEVETLNGDSVAVAVSDGGVTVNGATVQTADIIASNGIIHVVDTVLLPPTTGTTTTEAPGSDASGSTTTDASGTTTTDASGTTTTDASGTTTTDASGTTTTDAPAEGTGPGSIHDIASGTGDFSTLAVALDASAVGPAGPNLIDALSGDGTFTVFAPPNSAFEKLPEELVTKLLNATWQPQLQDILLYHALGSEVLSTDLEDGLTASTLNGEDITVNLNPPRINNNSNILIDEGLFDIEASNGIIHAVDSVLTPASVTSNIVDLAAASDDFSTLVAAVTAADLAGALSGDGPLTVFAPTNAAFAALPDGTLDSLLLPENKDQLVNVLLFHVVAANAHSAGLASGYVVTLSGNVVDLEVSDEGVTVNGANVIMADIIASNGIIHVIDTVLLPPTATAETTEASADEAISTAAPAAAPVAADRVDDIDPDGLTEFEASGVSMLTITKAVSFSVFLLAIFSV